MTTYATIRVHADVLSTARDIIHRLDRDGLLSEDDGRALADLVDPLPEEDIYGETPGIALRDIIHVHVPNRANGYTNERQGSR